MAESEIPTVENLIKHSSCLFRKHFDLDPDICGCAPGRVNLIGEHTDYNDGYVLPMALPMVTVIVGRRNSTRYCHIRTSCLNIDEPKEVTFEVPQDDSNLELHPGNPAWANYVKGVIANFKGKLCGFDALIASSVPLGGGLSSSAALEVATYIFLEGLDDEVSKLSLREKALACQKAEHEYAGTPCGIMDQFISFAGKKDHALILDCRSLEYDLVILNDPTLAVLITNTNVHHNLAESEYSNRKQQCERAAKILGKKSLRDVTFTELHECKNQLPDELFRRALHVVTEINRTVSAANALREGKYDLLGMLMSQSHESLRDNYEVSCPELDTVVNAALEIDGVLGSRMTGGGFGGCTVTLLYSYAIDSTICNIKKKYTKCPAFYICHPDDGARLIQLPV